MDKIKQLEEDWLHLKQSSSKVLKRKSSEDQNTSHKDEKFLSSSAKMWEENYQSAQNFTNYSQKDKLQQKIVWFKKNLGEMEVIRENQIQIAKKEPFTYLKQNQQKLNSIQQYQKQVKRNLTPNIKSLSKFTDTKAERSLSLLKKKGKLRSVRKQKVKEEAKNEATGKIFQMTKGEIVDYITHQKERLIESLEALEQMNNINLGPQKDMIQKQVKISIKKLID